MKTTLALFLATAALLTAADQTFTGAVTDSMCGKDHSAMKMGANANCATACVKAGAKYALLAGQKVYTLSDQSAPEKFAGKQVTVSGSLDEKTGVIRVTKIAPAK